MFEQSVVETRGAAKPYMLLAMTGQFVAAGILLVIPLMHPEVLNAPRRFIGVVLHTSEPVEQVEVKPRAASGAPSSGGPSMPMRQAKPFQAPNHIPTGIANVIDEPGAIDTAALSRYSSVPGNGPGVLFSIGTGVITTAPPAPALAREIVKTEAPPPVKVVRMSQGVQEAKMLHRVIPTYPPLAKAARIQGQVKLEGVISRDGLIQQLRVVSGHPLLVQAALDAVKQWRYRPTLLNGEPVEVISPIDVNFILAN